MGNVSNCQRLPVFEQFFGIALEVNFLELDANKDNLSRELRGKDVISVEVISTQFQESTGINDLALLQMQTSHQRRFLDRMLENDRLILILASLRLRLRDTIAQIPRAWWDNGDLPIESYPKYRQLAHMP